MIAKAAAILAMLASPVAGLAQDRSPRPPMNPKITAAAPMGAAQASPDAVAAEAGTAMAVAAVLRPRARPDQLEAQIAALRGAEAERLAPKGLDLMGLRPKPRPQDLLVQVASVAAPSSKVTREAAAPEPIAAAAAGTNFSKNAPGKSKGKERSKGKEPVSTKGSVCGVAGIKGEKIAPISSRVQGCGLPDGVRVTSVSGVRLSMAATIDCTTAKALNRWVDTVLQPAFDGQVVQLRIAGHYTCRPRNNKKGAKVSEHGRGKAIDIAGIVLANGKAQMVAGGFNQILRRAHRGACGIFGTTLGPGSDGYHEDHMHFDTASNRKPYCR